MAVVPQPIEGGPTSTTAFVGGAREGPRDTPVEARSFPEFQQHFGADGDSPLALSVRLFFENGGTHALIVRAGSDAAIGDADVSDPALQPEQRGLWALEQAEIFNLLCIPPFAPGTGGDIGAQTRRAAADYCAARRAFFIVDPLASWATPDDIINGPDGLESATWGLPRTRNAAVYFPRLRVADPRRAGGVIECAPGGAVAGLYARTDARGVWKAPAGREATLAGVSALAVSLTDMEQARLNPRAVNVLRTFPDMGQVVWGARTLEGTDATGSEWKYVPVRRLALFLEESIARDTRWAVFEPNDERLWSGLRQQVGTFLHQLFRGGAFQGTTERQAYLVKCDAGTTSQRDIDEGVVNILVGFAPLKPAEFNVISIRQRTAR
jgi:uncharacterized protein